MLLRNFELLPFTRKQRLDHPTFLRLGFPGEQVFEMGNISPCNEPVHDLPPSMLAVSYHLYSKYRGSTPNIAVSDFSRETQARRVGLSKLT